MTPGQIVNRLFCRAELCRRIGLSETTVWRWQQPAPRGTGGLIPARHHAKLLRVAREKGVQLTPDMLVMCDENA